MMLMRVGMCLVLASTVSSAPQTSQEQPDVLSNDIPYFTNILPLQTVVKLDAPPNTTVITLKAKSVESGADIHYVIVRDRTGGRFELDSATGEVKTKDNSWYSGFQRNMEYVLIVQAEDRSSTPIKTSSEERLSIVGGQRAPQFYKTAYKAEVPESMEVGYPILTIMAKSFADNKIRYTLKTKGLGKEVFTIHPETGVVKLVKELDWEDQKIFELLVTATEDGGIMDSSTMVNRVNLNIQVSDINDNWPKFDLPLYQVFNIDEDIPIGTSLLQINCSDADSTGDNANFVYSTNDDHFAVDSTGVLTNNQQLNVDNNKGFYEFKVTATDMGVPALMGTTTIRVYVNKKNSKKPIVSGNLPRFTEEEWEAEVNESFGDLLPNKPVLNVTILYDEDENNDIFYKVDEKSGFGADKFSMIRNSDGTGSLLMVRTVDFEDPEEQKGFRFRILVSANGIFDDDVEAAWVNIRVIDINDNSPIFEKIAMSKVPEDEDISELTVPEDAIVGTKISQVKATDVDAGGTMMVHYKIDSSSDPHQHFKIIEDGTISVQQSLDRETTPVYHLRILAIDDGIPALTSSVMLRVNIEDMNDNAPHIFYPKDNTAVLPEHQAPQFITEVKAKDADLPPKTLRTRWSGSRFHFKMDPKTSDVIRASFKVEHDDRTGTAFVSSRRSFDREMQKEYLIPISIRDSGNPPMTGTSILKIIIGDENDNKMQPGQKNITVYLYEEKSPKSEIGQVYVWDQDDWDLEDKTFRWFNQSSHPLFNLDKDTGMIKMNGEQISPGKYSLRFLVNDTRHKQLDVPANVTVVVKKVPHQAVVNSQFIRISGMSEEDFIRTWNWDTQFNEISHLQQFRTKLSEILDVLVENVEVFSVTNHPTLHNTIDVRFFVEEGSSFIAPEKLQKFMLEAQEDFERELDLNITMVGRDECLNVNLNCQGGCFNNIQVSSLPHMVEFNNTALVGLSVKTEAKCSRLS